MKRADTSKTNTQTSTEYIAPELKDFTVLGVAFQAFVDENGQKVFSEIGVERGMQPEKAKGWLKNIRSSRSRNKFTARQTQPQQALQPFDKTFVRPSNDIQQAAQYLKARTGNRTQTIRVITAAELLSVVSYLAERGNDRAIAMQEAGFAAILQQTIDEYDGIQRTHREYLEPAAKLRKQVERERVELSSISHTMTAPTFHCNVFKPNNDIIFGDGLTRDTYQGEDRPYRLMLEGVLESIQYGLRQAGKPLKEVITISHARIKEMLADKEEAAKVSQIKKVLKQKRGS